MAKNSNRSFIDAMHKKYKKHSEPDIMTGFAGNGFGYTGAGRDGIIDPKEPSGVVEEGEFVVSKPLVDAAGGPEAVQQNMEGMANSNSGQAMRDLPSFSSGGSVRSMLRYDDGGDVSNFLSGANNLLRSGFSNVKDTLRGAAKDISNMHSNVDIPSTNTFGSTETSSIDSPADIPKVKTFDSRGELEKIAAGEGDVARELTESTRGQLAGEAGVSRQLQAQTAAQTGLKGGALNASIARQRTKEGADRVQSEKGLFAENAQNAQTATSLLANMQSTEDMQAAGIKSTEGMHAAGLLSNEEMQAAEIQSTERMNAAGLLSNEEIQARQIESTEGIQALRLKSDETREAVANAIVAGDFEGASALMKENGYDVDFSQAISDRDIDTVNANYGDYLFDMESMPIDTTILDENGNLTPSVGNSIALARLEDNWNLTHPDDQVEEGKYSQAFKDHVENTMKTTLAQKSESYRILQTLSLTDKETWVSSLKDDYGNPKKLEDFEWGGMTGVKAFDGAVTTIVNQGGLDMGVGGDLEFNEHSVWSELFPGFQDPTTGFGTDDNGFAFGDLDANAREANLELYKNKIDNGVKITGDMVTAALPVTNMNDLPNNPEEVDENFGDTGGWINYEGTPIKIVRSNKGTPSRKARVDYITEDGLEFFKNETSSSLMYGHITDFPKLSTIGRSEIDEFSRKLEVDPASLSDDDKKIIGDWYSLIQEIYADARNMRSPGVAVNVLVPTFYEWKEAGNIADYDEWKKEYISTGTIEFKDGKVVLKK